MHQVSVIDLQEKNVLWDYNLGDFNTQNLVLQLSQTVDDAALFVWVDGWWLFAFNVNNTGHIRPLWKFTCLQKSASPTVLEYNGMYVLATQQLYPTAGNPLLFVSRNKTTGEEVVSNFTAPTTSDKSFVKIGHNNLVVPNLMGWSRWTLAADLEWNLQYHQLDDFNGVWSVLPQGDDGYVIIAGKGFAKYVF